MTERTTAEVPSGRSVSWSPFIESVKEYISFSTMSVTSPTPRVKTRESSRIGVRISW